MKVRDEILTILMEECAEVSIECSKVIRFDIDNTERLEKELGDVLMMIELLTENNIVSKQRIREASKQKREKLKTWSKIPL
jgi:NTP pyrophosphatase (non-canonical NTP hydrolase)|tara:strand:- start:154 stop:396 length:243 start_codon:yes stop_codon:yes gene_type:complete